MSRYLIVDDEVLILTLAQAMLTRMSNGDEFVFVENFDQAIAAGWPFDGVRSDLNFPGKNSKGNRGGIDLFSWMQENYPDTPFVFHTSNSFPEIKDMLGQNTGTLTEADVFSKPKLALPAMIARLKEKASQQEVGKERDTILDNRTISEAAAVQDLVVK